MMAVQWPLVIFTLFVSIGAGIFGVAGVLAGLGKGASVQAAATVAALVAVVIGGVASFVHLQHWDRAFNGFGNLSSGITQELVAIAVFVVLAVAYLVLSRRGGAPAWAGWAAALVSAALVVVMANSYGMAARPVWDTPLLWLYYLSNAVLFGGLAVAALQGAKGEGGGLALKVALVGGALTAVALVGYLVYIPSTASMFSSVGNYFDPTHPTKAMTDPVAALSGFATGAQALPFWGGALALGAVAPLAVSLLSAKREGASLAGMASVGALCAVAGAVCFRVVLYALGFSVFVFY